jgi:NAD(P)H-hydrate epimerase
MLVTAGQMRVAEEKAFRKGVAPEALMEVAGEGIARCIEEFFPEPGVIALFCGKGNNGADGLVVAKHLLRWGWRVLIRLSSSESGLPPLSKQHLRSLENAEIVTSIPSIRGQQLLLLDGLLGIGAVGTPRSTIKELIAEMNALRIEYGGFTVAVDLPSGLNASTGEIPGECVQADLTVTLGAVKIGLVVDTATAVVGRLALVGLPGVMIGVGDPASISTSATLRPLLPTRNFDSYKGTYGRIGILAGSSGFLGAARLCSDAAVHAGGGLVTLYALPDCHDLLAATCIPEIMVQRIDSYADISTDKLDVLALGPGLGPEYHEELRRLVRETRIPCVVDADALNAVAADTSLLVQCVGPRLFTPHPGEMERLYPRAGRTRRDWAAEFTQKYPVTLLLKGARTIIAEQGMPSVYNSTGNPGMGSGGMGDVLTGVCAALIGSGHSCRDAAMLGAWISGRAAEIAIFHGTDSQESLSASSVIAHLGLACSSLRAGDL